MSRIIAKFSEVDSEMQADPASPYHEGEQALQERTGMRDRLERVGRKVIRDFMYDQHRELFEALPMLLVGSLDARQRPWASILTGRPGFILTPDPHTLEVHASIPYSDPLRGHLASGAPLGLLGIELETRRRNRMNGRVIRSGEDGFAVRVEESFGNCPKYIQARQHEFVRDPASVAARRLVHREGPALSEKAARIVRGADTFFIASAAPGQAGDRQVDISHRGGKPGFVRLTADEDGAALMTVPDFPGNFHFATLGNLTLHPRAGLLFVDFASGDVLSLTGATRIIWDGPEVDAFAGAQRLLQIRIDEGFRVENAVPLRWSAPMQEPHLAATGKWNGS
jgi:uncharacterized protein